MKIKYYIDTSVFGGVYDYEFEVFSKSLFDAILEKNILILYSELTENELQKAPQKVKDFIKNLPKESIEYLYLTAETYELARKYIEEKVVGATSFEDCVHIALATLHRADVLISWNFKHIVNLKRIQGYNSVNMKNGLPVLEIRSPKELIDYENNEE